MLTINERLLHFIWQFHYFNKRELLTTEGEPITIIHSGQYNTNQGPDFLDARIKINDTLWAGQVEIHVLSSDWNKHAHQSDNNYNNVILHVVWQHDTIVYDSKGNALPTLELQPLTPVTMLQRYEALMQSRESMACKTQLPLLSSIHWLSWKERLVTERFERKATYILTLLQDAGNHWDEVFWWMIARNFGIKVNADVFEQVARSIPVNILAKSQYQLHQIEAMLLGQANLLQQNDAQDEYTILLQKEYTYLQAKYTLLPQPFTLSFLRMRPANFPSVRLAQLAMLMHQSGQLFSIVRDSNDINKIYQLLDVTASSYWDNHYRLGQASVAQTKHLGTVMVNNIIINTIAPILFTYGKYMGNDAMKEKALRWLEHVPAECNNITMQWQGTRVHNKCALDSQALIELYQQYCLEKKCLECAVGNKLLKSSE